MEALAVEGNNAGGFLTAVLERVQAKRGNRGCIRMTENAEYAAFLAQAVAVSFQVHVSHVLRLFLHYRVLPALGWAGGNSERWSGLLSGVSWSSSFGLFSLFKMVLSGSSGNIDISHCPVFCSTSFDLALRTQSGWLRSGTSQAKNRNATTTMISPRPSPKRKPSVRSRAPTRLSSTMSEMRAVMMETISRVARNTPPAETAAATVSLLKYCFAIGSTRL